MIDKLLGKLNAEIVIQVCGNFALANELGELPTELNQERADKHHAILAKYKSQLLAEILKAIGEDEEVPNDTWFREYGRLLGTDHREYIEMDNKRKANAIKAFYRTKFKELFNVKEK